MKNLYDTRVSERGGALAKLLVVLAIFGLMGNAGYTYVPVAYQGLQLKQEMNAAIEKATVLPRTGFTPIDDAKAQIDRLIGASDLPKDTKVEVSMVNNSINAHVAYKKKIALLPFGLYDYEYVFDHTAKPGSFAAK